MDARLMTLVLIRNLQNRCTGCSLVFAMKCDRGGEHRKDLDT
jgi:hypothetical protein